MVHFKRTYNTFAEAMDKDDGVVVIAVIFHRSSFERINPYYESMLKSLASVIEPNTHSQVTSPPTLEKLLPLRWSDAYYTYNGSLTTPPCSESVTWFVLENTEPIAPEQLREFLNLKSESGYLKDNFRVVQPIGDRKVHKAQCNTKASIAYTYPFYTV